jgi:hypothetical protein
LQARSAVRKDVYPSDSDKPQFWPERRW